MKTNRGAVWVLGVLFVAVLALVVRMRVHFDFGTFVEQLRHVDYRLVVLGIACIYGAYALRSVRWMIFMRRLKRVGPLTLLGSQMMGFTAVALFGRLADLVRPYLVARRTDTPVSSQIAIYTIERTFDLAAMAAIFSLTLALSPDVNSLPRHDLFIRIGRMGLIGTVVLAGLMIAIRVSGSVLAGMVRRGVGLLSPKLGNSVAEKVLAFRDGLNAISGIGDFAAVSVFSLVHWGLIVSAYVFTVHAFRDTPELAKLPFSHAMLLMAASMGGSAVQLPVIGWFTTIGVTAATMQGLFHAPIEAATGAGALMLIVTFMSVIPGGLIFARMDHVSLKAVTENMEDAEPVAAPS